MLETVTSPSSEQGMFALSWGWFVHLLIFYLSLSSPPAMHLRLLHRVPGRKVRGNCSGEGEEAAE